MKNALLPPLLSPVLSLCLLALALPLASCGNNSAASSGKPVVVSTILPYFDAVRAIGGDKIDARILVPPLASPHDYEPTIQNKAEVNGAKLFIKNGLGLDDQFDKLVDGTGAQVLNISKALPKNLVMQTSEVSLGDTGEKKQTEQAEESVQNPHIWLDPVVQMKAAQVIEQAMAQIDPADKGTFEANEQKYEASLKALDAEYRAAVPTFKSEEFIGFHSAYEYLARRYGLKQIASIEEVPEAGLNLSQAKKVIDLIKADHIHYIALEPGTPANTVDIITRETGARTIILQPIEEYTSLNDTYVSLMKDNLKALETVLGGSSTPASTKSQRSQP